MSIKQYNENSIMGPWTNSSKETIVFKFKAEIGHSINLISRRADIKQCNLGKITWWRILKSNNQ